MSISELLLVALIAFVVIKPENLPATARQLGLFTKGLRRTMHQIKQTLFEGPHK